jgi:hypothetical protein
MSTCRDRDFRLGLWDGFVLRLVGELGDCGVL